MDEPEVIVKLIETYPEYRFMYEEVYEMCRNTEKVMGMFSKELRELDRNTVQYMIDEMQDTIDEQKSTISEQKKAIEKLQEERQVFEKEMGILREQIEGLKKLVLEK